MKSVKVMRIDRVPVGACFGDVDGHGSFIRLPLHVANGKIDELEINKEDGSPILIDPDDIELTKNSLSIITVKEHPAHQ